MKTIAQIHIENLDSLAKPFGSQRQFALHLNKDPKQVNQWWGKGSARGIGPQLARELEEHFRKPRGWLDNDHSQLERLDGAIIAIAVKEAKRILGLTGQDDFDVESEPEIMAQAIRVALAMAQAMEEKEIDGSTHRDGEAFRAHRAESATQNGPQSEPAPRRARKSA